MSYELEVWFSPVHELVNSLHTYLCNPSYKRIDLGAKWGPKVRSTLTDKFIQELDKVELNSEWRFTYLLIYVSPASDTINGFLKWLQSITVGQLYESLAPYVNKFPDNMGDVRERLLYLLSEWNAQYFEPQTDAQLIERLRNGVERQRSFIGSIPNAEAAEQITNGMYFEDYEGFERLVLTPHFHFQPANIIHSFGKITFCQYPLNDGMIEDEDEPPSELYRLLRSVGERSRLRILRYLSKQPRTFTEVVKHIGISKGITYEHIFNLRCSGLLRVHMEGENATVYNLRTQAIRELEEQLLRYVQAE